jgi:hypothetical protein
MLKDFNAGFPPLKYVKKTSNKHKKTNISDLNIKNILNQNNKPMIVTDKPNIDVIDSL